MNNKTDNYRAREQRARRAAVKQGFALRKARTHVRESPLWGTYMLVDPMDGTLVAGSQSGYGLNLDEIEAALQMGVRV